MLIKGEFPPPKPIFKRGNSPTQIIKKGESPPQNPERGHSPRKRGMWQHCCFSLSQINRGVVLKQQQQKMEEKYFSFLSFLIFKVGTFFSYVKIGENRQN